MSKRYFVDVDDVIVLEDGQIRRLPEAILDDEEIEEEIEESPRPQKYKKSSKERKATACSNCGEEGHTKRTCTNSSTPHDGDHEPMSARHHDQCRVSKNHERDAEEVADNLGLELSEVRLAYAMISYDDYVKASNREAAKKR